MSSFLSACEYEVSHVSLDDILAMTIIENSSVLMNGKREYDYQGAIRDIFIKYSDKAVKEKKYQEADNPTFSYSFNTESTPFNYFSIDFYAYGKINTYCSGHGLTRIPKPQYTTYSLNKSTADKIYEEAKNRVEEVERIKKEHEEKAKDDANIYKLLNEFENPKDIKNRWIDYQELEEYEERGKRKTRINLCRLYNITTDIVDDLRGMEYQELADDRSFKDTIIECRGSDNWTISIERYQPYATVRYEYHNTLSWAELYVSYEINETKKNDFVKKIITIIKDQAN